MNYLYVIAHPSGWRKVGRSDNPARRLRQHQGRAGSLLIGEAVFQCEDAKDAERRALAALVDFRIMGEWFNITFEQAAAAVGQVTGSSPEPFPSAGNSATRKRRGTSKPPKDQYRYLGVPMIARIQRHLDLESETATYDFLSVDLGPWIDELRQRDCDLGKPPFEPDERWIAYVKNSMKETAISRRKNGS